MAVDSVFENLLEDILFERAERVERRPMLLIAKEGSSSGRMEQDRLQRQRQSDFIPTQPSQP